jgi:hypothetical protein
LSSWRAREDSLRASKRVDAVDVAIPPDKVALIGSKQCEMWVVEHCLHGVAGCLDDAGRFVLTFDVAAEAEAFRGRWLV